MKAIEGRGATEARMHRAQVDGAGFFQVQPAVMEPGVVTHHQFADAVGETVLLTVGTGKVLKHRRFAALLQNHQQALGNTKGSGFRRVQPHQMNGLRDAHLAGHPQEHTLRQPTLVKGGEQRAVIGQGPQILADTGRFGLSGPGERHQGDALGQRRRGQRGAESAVDKHQTVGVEARHGVMAGQIAVTDIGARRGRKATLIQHPKTGVFPRFHLEIGQHPAAGRLASPPVAGRQPGGGIKGLPQQGLFDEPGHQATSPSSQP